MLHKTTGTAIQLRALGLLLAVVKMIYLFFDFYNVLDLIVFLIAGLVFGSKLPYRQSIYGLLLALPAFLLCLIFVMKLGYTSIMSGIGTSFAVSLLVIPLATLTGTFLYKKWGLRKA